MSLKRSSWFKKIKERKSIQDCLAVCHGQMLCIDEENIFLCSWLTAYQLRVHNTDLGQNKIPDTDAKGGIHSIRVGSGKENYFLSATQDVAAVLRFRWPWVVFTSKHPNSSSYFCARGCQLAKCTQGVSVPSSVIEDKTFNFTTSSSITCHAHLLLWQKQLIGQENWQVIY